MLEKIKKSLSIKVIYVSEKKYLLDMLYKYKDAFSLGDETGTRPNVEIYK